jgi:glycosyltransferase involved in cell wall biosynthesis
MAKPENRPGPPLLVFADDWGRHPSSCQHLLRRLREDFRVLWVNTIGTRQVKADSITLRRGLEKLRNWARGLQQVGPSMWVIDLPMLPGLGNPVLREINRIMVTTYLKRILARLRMTRPTVLTTLPYMDWLIRGIRREALVYYCTDDYSHWPSADRETLIRADQEFSARADLILAASRALVASHEQAGRCRYFPHGVDFTHFASTSHAAVATDVSALPRPRIGFFGLIYEKLNFDLLAALARRFPRGSLVMIGPVAVCPPEFAQIPNVRLLGPRPYEQLPQYLAGLDVLLMPYVNDEMIRQSGPLKLRECLASGRPTVGIDIPDVRAYQPYVRIGATQEEFVEQVRQAVEEPITPDSVRARQASVEAEGWDQRAGQLRGYLAELHGASPTKNGRRTLRRVFHLRTISGKGGGPEKTLLNSPRFLADRYDMRLAYIRPEGDPEYDMPQRAEQMGVHLVDIPERSGLDPRTLWRLAREIRAFRPHLLHAHDYKTNVLGILLGRLFRTRVLTTMHGYVTRSPRLERYYAIDRWALRRMDHVIAVSKDLLHYLQELGVPASRCSLIENAIDTEQYRRQWSVAEAKRRLGQAPVRLVLGAVGRLSAEKGFDVLIRSVGQLIEEGLDVSLLIAGEGSERARLQELVENLGLGERVKVLGYCSDTRELYQALDIFVLSSLREGLPNVLLEAMALEVPVVATRIAGVPRLVEDGVNGVLVEPGDVEGLTSAVRRLASDPELRLRLGQAGRRRIEQGYSFAVRMEKIRRVYDEL